MANLMDVLNRLLEMLGLRANEAGQWDLKLRELEGGLRNDQDMQNSVKEQVREFSKTQKVLEDELSRETLERNKGIIRDQIQQVVDRIEGLQPKLEIYAANIASHTECISKTEAILAKLRSGASADDIGDLITEADLAFTELRERDRELSQLKRQTYTRPTRATAAVAATQTPVSTATVNTAASTVNEPSSREELKQ